MTRKSIFDRTIAIEHSYELVEQMAKEAVPGRPPFDDVFNRTIDLARWIIGDDDDDGGFTDFDGNPITPERLREMVNQ